MTQLSSASSEQPRRKILLVDDHSLIRQSLRNIMEAHLDLEVIGEAADGEQAIALTAQYGPDLVLMDINMPKLDGIAATRCIKDRWPHVVVIGLSVQCTTQAREALMQAGAVALLRKEDAGEVAISHDYIARGLKRARLARLARKAGR